MELGEHGGDAFGLAGGLLFHLLFVGVEQVGLGFGEFGIGETVVDGAAEFLFEDRHRLPASGRRRR